MSDLTILALDPATTTGWACSDGTGGAEDFGGKIDGRPLARLPVPQRHAAVAFRLQHWLESTINLKKPDVLLVERQLSHFHAHLLLGLRMVVLLAGWRRELLVHECWTSQWRSWAAKTDWWRKDNELDARAMLGWWVEQCSPSLEAVE